MGLEHKFFITSASRHIACGPKADNISQQSQPIIVFWGTSESANRLFFKVILQYHSTFTIMELYTVASI